MGDVRELHLIDSNGRAHQPSHRQAELTLDSLEYAESSSSPSAPPAPLVFCR